MGYVKSVIRKAKIKRNGKVMLEIRITINRSISHMSSGCEIDLKYWDQTKGVVKRAHPNSTRINNLLSTLVNRAEDYIVQKQTQGSLPSLTEVKSHVFKKNKPSTSIGHYGAEYLLELEQQQKFNRLSSENSRVEHMLLFYKGSGGFEQITENSLSKYKTFLKANFKHSDRTVVNHLILIRTLFNRAIKDNVIDANKYPFGNRGMSIKIPESIKIGLEMSEVELIEKFTPKENSTQWNARNVFLFSFYIAGARISDVLKVKWTDIKKDRLYYIMGKNKKTGSVKLTEKAKEILKLYKTNKKQAQVYVFPELNNCDSNDEKDIDRKINTATKKYNKWLKKMATDLEIDKPITCHVARHTFGNISGDKIPIQMLQKLYRHSSITTTVNYQQAFMNRDTDDALEKVLNGE